MLPRRVARSHASSSLFVRCGCVTRRTATSHAHPATTIKIRKVGYYALGALASLSVASLLYIAIHPEELVRVQNLEALSRLSAHVFGRSLGDSRFLTQFLLAIAESPTLRQGIVSTGCHVIILSELVRCTRISLHSQDCGYYEHREALLRCLAALLSDPELAVRVRDIMRPCHWLALRDVAASTLSISAAGCSLSSPLRIAVEQLLEASTTLLILTFHDDEQYDDAVLALANPLPIAAADSPLGTLVSVLQQAALRAIHDHLLFLNSINSAHPARTHRTLSLIAAAVDTSVNSVGGALASAAHLHWHNTALNSDTAALVAACGTQLLRVYRRRQEVTSTSGAEQLHYLDDGLPAVFALPQLDRWTCCFTLLAAHDTRIGQHQHRTNSNAVTHPLPLMRSHHMHDFYTIDATYTPLPPPSIIAAAAEALEATIDAVTPRQHDAVAFAWTSCLPLLRCCLTRSTSTLSSTPMLDRRDIDAAGLSNDAAFTYTNARESPPRSPFSLVRALAAALRPRHGGSPALMSPATFLLHHSRQRALLSNLHVRDNSALVRVADHWRDDLAVVGDSSSEMSGILPSSSTSEAAVAGSATAHTLPIAPRSRSPPSPRHFFDSDTVVDATGGWLDAPRVIIPLEADMLSVRPGPRAQSMLLHRFRPFLSGIQPLRSAARPSSPEAPTGSSGDGAGGVIWWDPQTGDRVARSPSWQDLLLLGVQQPVGDPACVAVLALLLDGSSHSAACGLRPRTSRVSTANTTRTSGSAPSLTPPLLADGAHVHDSQSSSTFADASPHSRELRGEVAAARLFLAERWLLSCLANAMDDLSALSSSIRSSSSSDLSAPPLRVSGEVPRALARAARVAAAKEFSRWYERHIRSEWAPIAAATTAVAPAQSSQAATSDIMPSPAPAPPPATAAPAGSLTARSTAVASLKRLLGGVVSGSGSAAAAPSPAHESHSPSTAPDWTLAVAMRTPLSIDYLPPFIAEKLVEAVRVRALHGDLPPLLLNNVCAPLEDAGESSGGSSGGAVAAPASPNFNFSTGSVSDRGVSAALHIHALKALCYLLSSMPWVGAENNSGSARYAERQCGAWPCGGAAAAAAGGAQGMCARAVDRGVLFPLAALASAWDDVSAAHDDSAVSSRSAARAPLAATHHITGDCAETNVPTAALPLDDGSGDDGVPAAASAASTSTGAAASASYDGTAPASAIPVASSVLRQCARLAAIISFECRGRNDLDLGDVEGEPGASSSVAHDDSPLHCWQSASVSPLQTLLPLACGWTASADLKLRCHALRFLQNAVGIPSVAVGDRLYMLYDATHIGTSLPAAVVAAATAAAAAATAATAAVTNAASDTGNDTAHGTHSDIFAAVASTAPATTAVPLKEVDVVFIHGLQGAPLKTWRTPSTIAAAAAAAAVASHPARDTMDRCAGAHSCAAALSTRDIHVTVTRHGQRMALWPLIWLAPDLEAAGVAPRIFAVNYDSDIFLSSSIRPHADIVALAADLRLQLERAGVGTHPNRRVVFVTHSMGGILVKELLLSPPPSSSSSPPTPPHSSLSASTAAVVFIATPHSGSPLASASLSRLGTFHKWFRAGDPAQGVVSSMVSMLNNPAELSELNDRFRALVAADEGGGAANGGIRVLSIGEGRATDIPLAAGWRATAPTAAATDQAAGMQESAAAAGAAARAVTSLPSLSVRGLASTLIVPPHSAYPGYGRFFVDGASDHVSICKPNARDRESYTSVLELITRVVAKSTS